MNPIIQAFHDFMKVTRKHVYNSNRAFTVLRNADMWSVWNVCALLLFDGLFSIKRGNEYPDRVQELAHIFMKPFQDIHDHRMVNMIQFLSKEYIQKRQLHEHFNDDFRQRMREMTWRQGLVQGRSVDEAYTQLLNQLDNPFDLPETIDDMSYETVLSKASQPSRKRSLSSSSNISPKRTKASQPSEANKQANPIAPVSALDKHGNCLIVANNFTHLDDYSTADKHDTIPNQRYNPPSLVVMDIASGMLYWGVLPVSCFPQIHMRLMSTTPTLIIMGAHDKEPETILSKLEADVQPNPNQMAQWLLRTTRQTYPNQEIDIQGDLNDFPQVLQVV